MRGAAAAVALLLAACGPSRVTAGPGGTGPAAEAVEDTSVAGTYELVLCRRCDSTTWARTRDRIRVSLYAEPLFQSGPLAGANPRVVPQLWISYTPENFCMDVPPGYRRGFVGIVRRAIHAWSRTPADSVEFYLYRSPDAGTRVRARVANGWMTGIVPSSGPFAGSERRAHDQVVGRRIGPPDPTVCGLKPGTAPAP